MSLFTLTLLSTRLSTCKPKQQSVRLSFEGVSILYPDHSSELWLLEELHRSSSESSLRASRTTVTKQSKIPYQESNVQPLESLPNAVKAEFLPANPKLHFFFPFTENEILTTPHDAER
jgi:hypothetical protein